MGKQMLIQAKPEGRPTGNDVTKGPFSWWPALVPWYPKTRSVLKIKLYRRNLLAKIQIQISGHRGSRSQHEPANANELLTLTQNSLYLSLIKSEEEYAETP
jgi:hypothetical protein